MASYFHIGLAQAQLQQQRPRLAAAAQISALRARALGAETPAELARVWEEIERLKAYQQAWAEAGILAPVAPAYPAPALPVPAMPEVPRTLPATTAPSATAPSAALSPPACARPVGGRSTAFFHSRSTSVGSSELSTSCGSDAGGLETPRGLERPVRFFVKNTFIEINDQVPSLADGFFRERKVRSCPGTPRNSEAAGEPESQSFAVVALAAARLRRQEASAAAPAAPAAAAPGTATAPLAAVPQLEVQVLRLAEVLGRPKLGSPELPSIGSADHCAGSCKPCAFAHTKGCTSGQDCQFCHLCEPGSSKRRKKEWRLKLLTLAATPTPCAARRALPR